MSDTVLMAVGAVLLVGWGVFVFALASRGGQTLYDPDNYDSTLCAPSRRANITASQPQAQRPTLGPPAGWREPEHVTVVAAPAPVEDDDEVDEFDDDDDLPVGVPEPVLTGKPEQPPVVVEPAPVVVDWTKARFGALEIRQ